MNLELNKSTGNLFVNKSEFFFNNEQFISNNIFLKKHLKVNGFDTYGFEVVFFECNFSLNIIFKDGRGGSGNLNNTYKWYFAPQMML